MNLFEINDKILAQFDEDTGEIKDVDTLNELQMQFDDKVESLALYYKETKAFLGALQDEKKSIDERIKRCKNKMGSIAKYLGNALDGNTFESPKVNISYRKSKSVVIDDLDAFMSSEDSSEYISYGEPKVDKKAIKVAIDLGMEFDGIHIEENINTQIK